VGCNATSPNGIELTASFQALCDAESTPANCSDPAVVGKLATFPLDFSEATCTEFINCTEKELGITFILIRAAESGIREENLTLALLVLDAACGKCFLPNIAVRKSL